MRTTFVAFVLWLLPNAVALADMPGKVIDISTRPGVSQRFLLIAPPNAKIAAILFVGSHGGLQITDSGALGFGRNNFLVRAVPMFVEEGVAVALIDAPSDRQGGGFLDLLQRERRTRHGRGKRHRLAAGATEAAGVAHRNEPRHAVGRCGQRRSAGAGDRRDRAHVDDSDRPASHGRSGHGRCRRSGCLCSSCITSRMAAGGAHSETCRGS